MTTDRKMEIRVGLKKVFLFFVFLCFSTLCFADPLPWIPTAYGGLIVGDMYAGKAVLCVIAAGLGTEYILIRLLTHKMAIKPLPWLIAFIGVHVVSWPLATYGISVLGDSQFLNSIAETIGAWSLLILVGYELVIGLVEGVAFGMIFTKVGTLRRWMMASIVGNLIGCFAGFAATVVIEQMYHSINH